MRSVVLAILVIASIQAADEKKTEATQAPVVTAEEKLKLKSIESDIYRSRLDQAAAKEREQKAIESYSTALQPLIGRCREKGLELTEALDCAPPKAAPVPAK